MSVPTITSLSPSRGPTAGRFYVEITGSNFKLPPTPAATGVVPTPAPTVTVLFDGRAATQVEVVSATLLGLLTPVGDPGPNATDHAVNVVLKNLDAAGVPIPGEQATLALGFTYALPPLTTDSDFTRIVAKLILDLRQQVCQETVKSVETDWSDSTSAAAGLEGAAKLPSLTLLGPRITRDGMRSTWAPAAENVGTSVRRHHFPSTLDLEFTLVIATNDDVELLNLTAQVVEFFRRNPWLYVDRDPDDASLGQVKYEMGWTDTGFPANVNMPNLSNLRSNSGTVLISGVDIESLVGFTDEGVQSVGALVDTVGVTYENTGA